MKATPATRRILSVSELNESSKQLLESAFMSIWVEGEISNFSAPSSGHWYFTLKDSAAQIRCAMFRNRNLRAAVRPRLGDHVVVRGAVSLYTARGEYQLIAEQMEPAGLGALQRALEALKRQLAAEGLFATERKRQLPAIPRHLAIITSPTGAALQDILTVLRRRYPPLRISLFPVAVQGEAAPGQIAAAIASANRHAHALEPSIDVMIVGRGGGSLEDLWAFNDERVARAIHASVIPVVAAVGHETDVTIADLVADVRAATPSAAAELVSPDGARLLQLLAARGSRMTQYLTRTLQARGERVAWLRKRLRHPGARLREQAQRLDDLEMRLQAAWRHRLQMAQTRLARAHAMLSGQLPRRRVDEHDRNLAHLQRRLAVAIRQRLRRHGEHLGGLVQLLDSISPLATMRRGYAIVTDTDDRVLRDASLVQPGARIRAKLALGTLECTVETATPALR